MTDPKPTSSKHVRWLLAKPLKEVDKIPLPTDHTPEHWPESQAHGGVPLPADRKIKRWPGPKPLKEPYQIPLPADDDHSPGPDVHEEVSKSAPGKMPADDDDHSPGPNVQKEVSKSAPGNMPATLSELPIKFASDELARPRTPAAARPLARTMSEELKAEQKLRRASLTATATQPPWLQRKRSSTTCDQTSTHQRTDSIVPLLPSPLDLSAQASADCSSQGRRLSHGVLQREKSLRAELSEIKDQFLNSEERRTQETVAVSFAVGRMLDQQQETMRAQANLLKKLEELEVQAAETAKEAAAMAEKMKRDMSSSSLSSSKDGASKSEDSEQDSSKDVEAGASK